MITTVDNPFDPFTQFDEWYQWDTAAGYHTCSLLARFVHTSNELSDEEQLRDVERAIDTVVELNVDGVYRKLIRED